MGSDPVTSRLTDLGTRLERIEEKLDNHLERVSKAESDISWIRGHLRIATTLFLAALGTIGTILLNMYFPRK